MKAKTDITYHGRSGRPIIRCTVSGNPYIMVRAKGGGTKRLHLRTDHAARSITKGYRSLLKEAIRHCRASP